VVQADRPIVTQSTPATTSNLLLIFFPFKDVFYLETDRCIMTAGFLVSCTEKGVKT